LPQAEGGNRCGGERGEEACTESIGEAHEEVRTSGVQDMGSQKAVYPRIEINEVTGSFCCEKDSDASSTCPGDDGLPQSMFSPDGRNCSMQ